MAGQKQLTVELKMRDRSVRNATATATGNNAAWLCVCGYKKPLIGRTFEATPKVTQFVECEKCHKHYHLYPENGESQKRVEFVQEVKSQRRGKRTSTTSDENKLSTQIIGNIGLFHVCYELSRRNLNVVPTSRNTKSVDVIVGNEDFSRHVTVQVKASTTELGTRIITSTNREIPKEEAIEKSMLANFWVFVRLDKNNHHNVIGVHVCLGGDSDLLAPSRNMKTWWYEPWYPTPDDSVTAKWSRQKNNGGWDLITKHLSKVSK